MPDTGLILLLLVVLPLAGALAMPVTQRFGRDESLRWLAVGVAGIQLACAAALWALHDTGAGADLQFVTRLPLVDVPLAGAGNLAIELFLGADGLSLPLLVLAPLVMFAAILVVHPEPRRRTVFYAGLLVLDFAAVGALASLDLFVFLLLWALLAPVIWMLAHAAPGDAARRSRSVAAAWPVVLGLVVSTATIAVPVMGLYASSDVTASAPTAQHTFAMPELSDGGNYAAAQALTPRRSGAGATSYRFWAAMALLGGLLLAMPVVPLHAWLMRRFSDLPVSLAIVLCALVSKIAGYGIIRIGLMMFPDVFAMPGVMTALGVLGVVTIVYAALAAASQRDLFDAVAWIGIAHTGFVPLGIASLGVMGLSGAIAQLFTSGVIVLLLLLAVEAIRARTGTTSTGLLAPSARSIRGMMPVATLGILAAAGLPGLAGFWPQLEILLDAVAGSTTRVSGIVAMAGLLLLAVFLVRGIAVRSRSVRGPGIGQPLPPLSPREWTLLAPPALLIVMLGIWPMLLAGPIAPSAAAVVEHVRDAVGTITTAMVGF